MKFKEILVRIFDYNRNGKTDWYELLFGTIFMVLYVSFVMGCIIVISLVLNKMGL